MKIQTRDELPALLTRSPGQENLQPASLDFAYVDGYAHEGNEDGETLRQWWEKIRPGGLFAG